VLLPSRPGPGGSFVRRYHAPAAVTRRRTAATGSPAVRALGGAAAVDEVVQSGRADRAGRGPRRSQVAGRWDRGSHGPRVAEIAGRTGRGSRVARVPAIPGRGSGPGSRVARIADPGDAGSHVPRVPRVAGPSGPGSRVAGITGPSGPGSRVGTYGGRVALSYGGDQPAPRPRPGTASDRGSGGLPRPVARPPVTTAPVAPLRRPLGGGRLRSCGSSTTSIAGPGGGTGPSLHPYGTHPRAVQRLPRVPPFARERPAARKLPGRMTGADPRGDRSRRSAYGTQPARRHPPRPAPTRPNSEPLPNRDIGRSRSLHRVSASAYGTIGKNRESPSRAVPNCGIMNSRHGDRPPSGKGACTAR
jgi:hypothetical protein